MALSLKQPSLIIVIIGVVIVLIGVLGGLLYLNQSQDTRKSASNSTGTVEINIEPTTLTMKPGETKTATVKLNTKGTAISTIGVKLIYSGTGSPLQLSAPTLNAALVNWMCPTLVPGSDGKSLEVGCIVTQGYTSNTAIDFFTFTITASSDATAQSVPITFAAGQTTASSKTTGKDIAAIPTGGLTVVMQAQATATPTATPTSTPTATPTETPTATPTATPDDEEESEGIASCNETCTANRDCEDGLACRSGVCRDTRCPNDSSCGCDTVNVASESGTTTLPTTGFNQTISFFFLGLFFIVGGAQLLYIFSWKEKQN